jgi:hypothetical protein
MFQHVLFTSFLLIGAISYILALSEPDRLQEYEARGYEWPLLNVKPNTPGWQSIFDRRFKQIEETIDDSTERYNAWMQVMSSSFVQPNFTENGWGLTKAPQDLVDALANRLHGNIDTAPLEMDVDVIEGSDESSKPLFISNYELNARVLEELKPMHEEWAGVDLVGEIAYGLRVYRNNSRLLMHVDKPSTHIISCILHIDHSEDSEPWPIIIEDFQGNTNEVVLESGDMLFYESSKCFHGRPHTFKGSWYSSIFVHYSPVGWEKDKVSSEVHYAVPKHWSDNPSDGTTENKLEMLGTSMKEPECENVWCGLKNTVKWNGPAIQGEIITTGWIPTSEKSDKEEEL